MQAIISFKTFASSRAAFRASFPRSSAGWGPHGGHPQPGQLGWDTAPGLGDAECRERLREGEELWPDPSPGWAALQDLPCSRVEADTRLCVVLGDRAGNRSRGGRRSNA